MLIKKDGELFNLCHVVKLVYVAVDAQVVEVQTRNEGSETVYETPGFQAFLAGKFHGNCLLYTKQPDRAFINL